MASKIAKQWLSSIGQPIEKVHTSLELANFAAGDGSGKFSMPYHLIRMDSRYGDSKTTVDWADTLASARTKLANLKAADSRDGTAPSSGAEYIRNRYFTFYIRDIRNGKIYW